MAMDLILVWCGFALGLCVGPLFFMSSRDDDRD
jgi:hypothetical protein